MRRVFSVLALVWSIFAIDAEPSYLITLLSATLDSSGTSIALRSDLESAQLSADLERLSWLPRFSVDSPRLAAYSLTGSENVLPLDAPFNSNNQKLFSLSMGGSAEQKLPGSGLLRLELSQETQYATSYKAWRENPAFTFSLRQPIGPGAFDFNGDPGRSAAREALARAGLSAIKANNELILRSLAIMKAYETAADAVDYAVLALKASELRADYAGKLAEQGRETSANLWKSQAEADELGRAVDKAIFDLQTSSDDWTEAFGTPPRRIEDGDRDALAALFAPRSGEGDSLDLRLQESDRRIEELKRVQTRLAEAPVLSLRLSLVPDTTRIFFQKDFIGSWRSLAKDPLPLGLSLDVGLSYAIPGFASRATETRLSFLALFKKDVAILDAAKIDLAAKKRLERRVKELGDYRIDLDKGLERNEALAKDREELFARGELSPIDAADSQASSMQLRARRAAVVWDLIESEARLLVLFGEDLAKRLAEW